MDGKNAALWLSILTAAGLPQVHAGTEASDAVEQVVVVGSTPVPGSDVSPDQVVESTHVLGPADINRTGVPSLTGALLENVASVTINDTEGNVFQPDILFRGFTASPVAGTPEGIAVYVNGARFNNAFGDVVNWDLIPPSAIESANLEASNPVFGLNALGGSLSVRLKTGFDAVTDNFTAYGGTYGRAAGILEIARRYGDYAIYAVADVTHDEGFRDTSESNLYRFYTDLGWRGEATELHLGITAAADSLGNPGASPVQALNANIANIFTAPNVVDNTYLGFNLNGTLTLSPTVSLQGVAYLQTLNQVVPNGTTADVAPCDDGTGLLCNDDGTVVTGVGGTPVADFLNGGPYSGLSVQQLNSHAYGLSGQATETAGLSSLPNHLVAGLSFDGSRSIFAGITEIGGFDPYSREFLNPGVIQDQPDEGVNPVRVQSNTRFYGVFLTDVLTVLPNLDLSLAGRYNDAQIVLQDLLGGPVNGAHAYDRFNPSGGLTLRILPALQVYANYAQTNRAPTPEELSCASAANPCSLLNFFVGDPNLNQVVAHTYEVGLRGQFGDQTAPRLRWSADVYHIANTNDIIYETTSYNPNLAFYTNAGRTLRQGAEANLRFDRQELHVSASYAFIEATFQTPLLLNTNSPAADANGNEQVEPGDRIPGIPKHRANLVVDYSLSDSVMVGGSVQSESDVYRFGDEANLAPPISGYTIVDLNASYHPRDYMTFFAVLNNAFNKRYYTYGSFAPVSAVPWPNVPGGVTDPSTASPGTPITIYAGVRLTF
jgi:outer membrane receptor protein involved in Fe transport